MRQKPPFSLYTLRDSCKYLSTNQLSQHFPKCSAHVPHIWLIIYYFTPLSRLFSFNCLPNNPGRPFSPCDNKFRELYLQMRYSLFHVPQMRYMLFFNCVKAVSLVVIIVFTAIFVSNQFINS